MELDENNDFTKASSWYITEVVFFSEASDAASGSFEEGEVCYH
jgi:hypothetical protein